MHRNYATAAFLGRNQEQPQFMNVLAVIDLE
jgi:hypothetical protein